MQASGSALSRARRAGGMSGVDLRALRSMEEAWEVQEAANTSHGGLVHGFCLAATNALTARLLQCPGPIVGLLFDEHDIGDGAQFRLPHGMIGAGAQIVFRIGAPLKEPLTLGGVRDAIVSCQLGLQLLGRRVRNDAPLNEWSATADFALDVACVRGSRIDDWDSLRRQDAALHLDGALVATSGGADVVETSLASVAWLAQSLRQRGVELQPGDVVAAGSCTGLAQIVPGQHVRAVFGDRGHVELFLE